MKKVLFIFLFLGFSFQSAYSQFEISLSDLQNKNGVLFTQLSDNHLAWWDDNSSSYAIVSINGLKQKDIYQKLLLALNDYYGGINGISKIEYDAITVHAYQKCNKALILGKRNYNTFDGFKYRLSFKFKDGKMRIEAPLVTICDYHSLNDSSKRKDLSANIEIFPRNSIDLSSDMDEICRSIISLFTNSIKEEW